MHRTSTGYVALPYCAASPMASLAKVMTARGKSLVMVTAETVAGSPGAYGSMVTRAGFSTGLLLPRSDSGWGVVDKSFPEDGTLSLRAGCCKVTRYRTCRTGSDFTWGMYERIRT